MAKLILTVDHDPEVDNPSDEGGGWRLYSFNSRHASFKHPNEFFPLSIGLRRKLQVGTAFLLSYYEHGNCRWMLRGSDEWAWTPDKQWDGVSFAGLLVWEGDVRHLGPKTYADRTQDAKVFCDIYTDWCNGNTFWFSLETVDGDDREGSGGIIGDEWLADCINEFLQDGDEIVEVRGELRDMVQYLKLKAPINEREPEEEEVC